MSLYQLVTWPCSFPNFGVTMEAPQVDGVTLTFFVQHPRNDEDAPYSVCVTLPDIDPHNISGIQNAMDYWKRAFERYFPGSQVQHETYEQLTHSFGGLATDEFMQEREATLREREKLAGDKVMAIDSR